MPNLTDLLRREEMTLIVSLPRNDVEMARAALAGGAESLKVHVGVQNAASGVHFGSLEEEGDRLGEILLAAGEVPVGIVAGGEKALSEEEFTELLSLGFDWVDLHAHHIPAWMWLRQDLLVAAIDETYTPDEVAALNMLCPDGIEIAVVPESGYGQPLSLRDLMRFAAIRECVECPLIVPTQRRILPGDVRALGALGIDGLMIGAIVTGVTPASVRESTASYQRTIRDLT